MAEEITCTGCGATVDPLEVFPHKRCLACHAKATEHDAPPTAAELARMFGRSALNI